MENQSSYWDEQRIPTAEELEEAINTARGNGWANVEPKKRAFAMAYTDFLCHIRATREIGIDTKFGLRYLRDPMVLAMIEDIQASHLEVNLITRSFVQQKWMEILPKLMGEEAVNLIYRDEEFSGKKFHSSETVAVLKELGHAVENFYKDKDDASGGKVEYNVYYSNDKETDDE